MGKNTIGQFISILRKANGLTQQDVADRLGVSSKAVSRWERDETAPDILLIPAIAELFGVSCDELLKGERIISEEKTASVNNSKQIKMLMNKALSNFKTLSIISISLSAVSYIAFFGIAFGYYKTVLGFSIMLLFLVAAFVISLISLSKIREIKNDDEIFAMAEEKQQRLFNKTFGNYSYFSFFSILAVIILTSSLTPGIDRYIALLFGVRTLWEFHLFNFILLLLICLCTKDLFVSYVTNEKMIKIKNPLKKKLNILQLSFIAVSSLILIFAEYFNTHPYKMTPPFFILTILALALLLMVIVVFIIFLIKHKSEKEKFILSGIKNILLIPVSILIGQAHQTEFFDYYPADPELADRYDVWHNEYIGYAIILILVVCTLYKLIEKIKKAKKEL